MILNFMTPKISFSKILFDTIITFNLMIKSNAPNFLLAQAVK